MSTLLSFERVKDIQVAQKDIVFGYIRSINHDVPELVLHTILLFYLSRNLIMIIDLKLFIND